MKRRRKSKPKLLGAIRPNVGIERAYRKKLYCLIDEMARSFAWWLRAAYRANEPVMAILAQDATPANELRDAVRKLARQWQTRWDEAAPELADYFATAARKRSDATLRKILKDGGITVKFKMTAPMRDVFAATVAENVSLIRSIPQEFHTQVEGLVMRSVQSGRDLGFLTKELQKRFGVTRRRAAFIALDQNNKVTSELTKVRQLSLGIEEGIWQHSHAGKEPRPTHLANDGKKFDLKKGWFDPDPKVRYRIWPGQLPRCRCTFRGVIKGFD